MPGSPLAPLVEQLKSMAHALSATENPLSDADTNAFIRGKIEGLESAITLVQRAGAIHIATPEGQRLVKIETRTDVDPSIAARVARLEREVRDIHGRPVEPRKAMPEILKAPRATRTAAKKTERPSSGGLPRGECRVLTEIALHLSGVTRAELTVNTGYKRSSRDTYVQRLRDRGFIGPWEGGVVVASAAGVIALGPGFKPLPHGDALRTYWLNRLPAGERHVLTVLITAFPNVLSRDQLSELTGYKRSSRDTYLQRLLARRLIEINAHKELRAASKLFSQAFKGAS